MSVQTKEGVLREIRAHSHELKAAEDDSPVRTGPERSQHELGR